MLSSLLVLAATLVGLVQGQTPAQRSAANDLTTLNYALTLENLENSFYAAGLAKFNTSAQFVAAGYAANVLPYLQIVGAHEASHVAFLTTAINSVVRNAAVPNCRYNFTAALVSVNSFLMTAAVLENTGQTAYVGALNRLSNQAYAQVAAQVATVEARHAAYLNQLTGVSAFPNSVDPVNLPDAIAAAITPFLISCPYNITLPTVRPEGVALNAAGRPIVTGSITTANYTAAQRTNDLAILNYALTLERFSSAYYTNIFSRFNESSFIAAGFSPSFYNQTRLIALHESLHVSTLEAVINQRVPGGAVPACVYDFRNLTRLTGPGGFLNVSSQLEEIGTRAYLGVANAITDTNLQQVAAAITTVEARHVAYLNTFMNISAFPVDQDVFQSPSEIFAALFRTGYLISCPYTPVTPQLLPFSLSLSQTSIRGDPAFIGFHGQSFQVHGIPNRYFSLLTSPQFQFSAKFVMIQTGDALTASEMKHIRISRQIQSFTQKRSSLMELPLTTAFSHSGTFLGEIGLQMKGIKVFARAGDYETGIAVLTINDIVIPVSSQALEIAPGCFVTHSHSHTITIDTDLVSFTLVNSDKFFNLEQANLNIAYSADLMMEGLLGQTANPQWKVENSKEFKTHMVYDYLISGEDLFSIDTVTNLYNYEEKKSINQSK